MTAHAGDDDDWETVRPSPPSPSTPRLTPSRQSSHPPSNHFPQGRSRPHRCSVRRHPSSSPVQRRVRVPFPFMRVMAVSARAGRTSGSFRDDLLRTARYGIPRGYRCFILLHLRLSITSRLLSSSDCLIPQLASPCKSSLPRRRSIQPSPRLRHPLTCPHPHSTILFPSHTIPTQVPRATLLTQTQERRPPNPPRTHAPRSTNDDADPPPTPS